MTALHVTLMSTRYLLSVKTVLCVSVKLTPINNEKPSTCLQHRKPTGEFDA